MSDDRKPQDVLAAGRGSRSTRQGDVPDAIWRHYYMDNRGGDGLGYYVDAQAYAPAFRDRGRALVAAQRDSHAIRDMATIARHRGWTTITVSGSADFRREAWLEGRAMGVRVGGYRPSDRDLQALQRRSERPRRAEREVAIEERREDRRGRDADRREVRRERQEDVGAHSQLRVVEALVRSRLSDPQNQARIMDAARSRIANWLDQGAAFRPMDLSEREPRVGLDLRRGR